MIIMAIVGGVGAFVTVALGCAFHTYFTTHAEEALDVQ